MLEQETQTIRNHIQEVLYNLNQELYTKRFGNDVNLYYTLENTFLLIYFQNDIVCEIKIPTPYNLETLIKSKFNYYIDQLTKLKF